MTWVKCKICKETCVVSWHADKSNYICNSCFRKSRSKGKHGVKQEKHDA